MINTVRVRVRESKEKQMSERRTVVEEGGEFGVESEEGLVGKRRKTTTAADEGDYKEEINIDLVMWGASTEEDELDIQIGEETVNELMKVLELELHFNHTHSSISDAADGESCGSSFSNPACTIMAGMNIATIYPYILLNQQEEERQQLEPFMASALASTHGDGVGDYHSNQQVQEQVEEEEEEEEDDDAWLERVLSGSPSFYFDQDDQAPIL